MLQTNIPYTLKRSSRARTLRLTIYPGGALVVTAPKEFSQEKIESFIFKKSDWISRTTKRLAKYAVPIKIKNSKAHFKEHKERALAFVKERVLKLNTFYNFKVGEVSIKNQKTRWGSCSKRGNLSFNYRLVFLPEHLADYIVVHELCHLAEFNHSKNFWSLVAKVMPEYKKYKEELKRSGFSL